MSAAEQLLAAAQKWEEVGAFVLYLFCFFLGVKTTDAFQ